MTTLMSCFPQDTSTGHIVAQHKTKMGPCDVLRHNPYNGVSLLGHANGTVTMWAPNTGTPLVKMLVHRVRSRMLRNKLYMEVSAEAWAVCL